MGPFSATVAGPSHAPEALMTAPSALYYTEDQEANELLASDPLALLIGLVLYQQVPIEKAFGGPLELQRRLGEPLDAEAIAAMEVTDLEDVFKVRPALHRFPAAMARRVHAVCVYVTEEYDGDAAALWQDVASADELLGRIAKLPGFGDYKATLTASVLIHQYDVKPVGWEEVGLEPGYPNLAEVSKPADLPAYKERKKAWKAAQKG